MAVRFIANYCKSGCKPRWLALLSYCPLTARKQEHSGLLKSTALNDRLSRLWWRRQDFGSGGALE